MISSTYRMALFSRCTRPAGSLNPNSLPKSGIWLTYHRRKSSCAFHYNYGKQNDYYSRRGDLMDTNAPTLEEWRGLYDAARMFKEFAQWEWMEDSDMFGIKDPESGETGYCCVLGALGEVYGCIVYLGSEGLALYEQVQSGETDMDGEAFVAAQKCLALTFDDREMLEKRDLEIIKSLGLKFRGRQAWPCFRCHLPGFVPWYLTGPEARFLELAIRHTMGMGERLRENPEALVSPEPGTCLVAYSVMEGGKRVWGEKWVKPAPYEPPKLQIPIDEVRLARIKAASRRVEDSWEVDFFFGPFVIEEGERPFFPYVALYTVHKQDYVLNFFLAAHSGFEKEFLPNFLDLLEKVKVLPKAIMVRKDTVYDFFSPIVAKLGVSLKKVKNLKSVEDAKASLISHMSR
jgi:hypothetical protein